MKLRYSPTKPYRYMKYYIGVQLDYDQPMYWWDSNIKRWTLTPNWNLGEISNTFRDCHSAKAFKRRLYEWSQYLPNNTKFILIGRYMKQDVYGKTKNK